MFFSSLVFLNLLRIFTKPGLSHFCGAGLRKKRSALRPTATSAVSINAKRMEPVEFFIVSFLL